MLNKDEIKRLLYVNIISADNFNIEEDTKQEIMARQHSVKKDDIIDITEGEWSYILDPIEDSQIRQLYLDLLCA